jgi:predicted SprT family Zn-dependent metalloprotease
MANPSQELERAALTLIENLVARHPLGYKPRLIWRPFRTTAGQADWSKGTISLGVGVIDCQEKLRDTVLHEYAHLLAVQRKGEEGRGHSPAWRQAMKDLGVPADVKHNYACRPNKRRQVVLYGCSKCHREFVRSRQLSPRKSFYHLGCGGRIELMRIIRVTAGEIRS